MKPRQLEVQLERLHSESFGWAVSCCGFDEMEAEDVLQTTYLKIITGAARFAGRSSLKTWLFGVIRRTAQEASAKAQSERRKRIQLMRDSVSSAETSDPEGALVRAETTGDVRRAMGLLSSRQREVLHLVFYQDLSISEAADVMEVSLGSARTHYERGKKRLRALLAEDQDVA
jgi:RNA polymerase sigma-70 factor (ECF subfamily)